MHPRQVQQDSFQNLFANMNFSDECRAWDAEADLVRVIKYVRGTKKLCIPPGWRPYIPTSIP